MSEQLADLARALTDLGLVDPLIENGSLHIYRPKEKGAVHMKFVITERGIVFLGEWRYGAWETRGTIHTEDWPILDLIREWQSPPPVAPDGFAQADGFSPDIRRALLEYEGCAMSYGTILDSFSENSAGPLEQYKNLLAARAHIAKLIDEIKRPPVVPDGFAQAVENVIEDAKIVQEVLYGGDVAQAEAARHLAASKAALLAYAPTGGVTITEDRKDRVIRAARDIWLCGQGVQTGERREPCINARAELMDSLLALDAAAFAEGDADA